jgi:ABC-2 type transport system permease protein
MHKILLILQREYWTRVRKKSFIVMTLLGPLFFAAMWAVPIWIATQEGDDKVIEVLDESGLFVGKFPSSKSLRFSYINESLDQAKKRVPFGENYGLLYIPKLDIQNPSGISFFSEKNPSLDVVMSIEKTLKNEIEDHKMLTSGIDKEILASIKTKINVNTINLSDGGEKESNAGISSIIGYISGFLLYMYIFINGTQVMRGIIEEKTNRIVEVIISSVRPFQLMMGKILGIAAVSLTQFAIWIILTVAISSAFGAFLGMSRTEYTSNQLEQVMAQNEELGAAMDGAPQMEAIFNALTSVNIPLILSCFIFYFLGGYLLYASMFAAVGSAVESDADSQQFMFPISMPLIMSIVGLAAVIKEPDGGIAFWMSMIPLTSPVVMLARLPFGVPAWEIALSMSLLIIGFTCSTWLAGRIYRVGILMHGSKVNYRVLAKWLLMKN